MQQRGRINHFKLFYQVKKNGVCGVASRPLLARNNAPFSEAKTVHVASLYCKNTLIERKTEGEIEK